MFKYLVKEKNTSTTHLVSGESVEDIATMFAEKYGAFVQKTTTDKFWLTDTFGAFEFSCWQVGKGFINCLHLA